MARSLSVLVALSGEGAQFSRAVWRATSARAAAVSFTPDVLASLIGVDTATTVTSSDGEAEEDAVRAAVVAVEGVGVVTPTGSLAAFFFLGVDFFLLSGGEDAFPSLLRLGEVIIFDLRLFRFDQPVIHALLSHSMQACSMPSLMRKSKIFPS